MTKSRMMKKKEPFDIWNGVKEPYIPNLGSRLQ
jgi:hypothetical protein